MRKYWLSVWNHAVGRFKLQLSQGRDHVIRFMVQTALLFAVLYFQPWFGVFEDEAKIVGAGILSVITSMMLFFIVDLVKAPHEIDGDKNKKIQKMGKAIVETIISHEDLEYLSELYSEGVSIYDEVSDIDDWERRLGEWDQKVQIAIKSFFELPGYHQYMHYRHYDVRQKEEWGPQIGRDLWQKMKLYTSRLEKLDNLVSGGGMRYIGDVNCLKEIGWELIGDGVRGNRSLIRPEEEKQQ